MNLGAEFESAVRASLEAEGFVVQRITKAYYMGLDATMVRVDCLCPCGGVECLDAMFPTPESAEVFAAECGGMLKRHIKQDVADGKLPAEWLTAV